MENGDLFRYKDHIIYMYFKDASVAFYHLSGSRRSTNQVTDENVKERVEEGATFICNLGEVLHRIYQGELK